MKNLLLLLSFFSLPALAQGPVRSVDTISDLVNTVNPAASAQGESVIYAVKGYRTPGDFGSDRFFTASTTAAATNLAHVFRSAKNSSYYWTSLDLNSPNQDPRWWGAWANSTNNSITNIQAALDYSDPHARRLWLPGGTYFTIDKPIKFDTGMSGGNDYMSVELIGNGAKLICTAPTNIIQLEAQSIFYGKLEDTVFTYDQAYTNTTANVISLRGDPTGPNYYNVYNVSFNNLTFLRGYYAIKQEEWCSPWGNKYTQWFVSQELTGGAVDFAPSSNFGNVNNVFESIYCRADIMAGPVFKIKNQNLLAMRDIEINVLHDKQALLLTASSSVDIRNWRMEVGSFNNSYDGLFQLANVTQMTWDNLQIQSFDLDAPAGTWNYIIRDVGSGPAINISSLQVNNLYLKNITKTNTASYLAFIYSPYQRYTLQTWDSDLSLVNAYAAYPFGAPATNVTAQPWHRNITDLPTLPGEISFDANNWPYISTGIGSVTNWLRLGNADVFGPASSTDNAVARFDGTTGKRIQNSLMTVDDTGNIVSPGQTFVFGPGYGNPIISLDGQKGEGGAVSGVRAIDYLSAGTLRWRLGANSTTETNINNSGSEFELQAFSNAGGYLRTVWRAMRDTGVFQTFGDVSIGGVGAADAPTIGYNTGSPEGLYAAYPGSLRLDKSGNLWIKDSGAGTTTGWIQMPEVAGGSSYTNFFADLTNALVAGANVTITPNSPSSGKITIAATGSGGGATNGTSVSVNSGGALSTLNIQDSTGILASVSGTNGSFRLADRDWGDFTSSSSGTSFALDADSVALGTDTTGDYVASVSGTANEVTASGSGEGAAVTLSLPTTIDLGSKTSFELPNAAAPTVDAFGEVAGDNDAWAAGRGALVTYDGTAATRLLAVLASDTPSAGQVPKYNSDGTITWESDSAGSTNSGTVVSVDGVQQSVLNITNGAIVTKSLVSSNLSFDIATASFPTSRIDSVFYNFITAQKLSDGDKGDVTVGGSGTTLTIDADSVALGTDTTGNYIASVSGTANEVTASGSGEGAAVTLSLSSTIDLGGKTSFEVPNAAAPTVDTFGEIAGDNDAWAASRGAVVFYDGTAATRLVGVLASDTPSNGQVPKWNTGGTITWEDDASSAGGGGLGTNLFVNGVLKQPAKLTNSASVTWNTNANGDIYATSISVTNSPVSSLWQRWGYANVIVTNNNSLGDIQSSAVGGYISSVAVVGSGANTAPLVLELTFSQSRDTNYLVVCEFEATISDYAIEYWIEEGNRGTGSVRVSFTSSGLSVFATPGHWMRVSVIEPNATAGGMGGDVIAAANNVFTGSNTFNGNTLLGTTNLATAIAEKAPLASPALTGTPTVNSTNLMAYARTAHTNWLAGQTLGTKMFAFQAHAPASNPAASATRNAVPVLEFDFSTQQQARWMFGIPQGYTASTVTVVLKWTTAATSGNGRWGVRFWDVDNVDIDSDSFASPTEVTTACSATAGTTVTTTLTSVNLDGASQGEDTILEVYRDTGDAADTINANTLQLVSVEVRAE